MPTAQTPNHVVGLGAHMCSSCHKRRVAILTDRIEWLCARECWPIYLGKWRRREVLTRIKNSY